MPLVSVAVLGLPVLAAFGPLAAVMIALWAWRVPTLLGSLRATRLMRQRRQEAYLLIVLVGSGVSVDKPVWSIMRDVLPKLPRMIGQEVRLIVTASRARMDYDPAVAIQQLGERWHLPELIAMGQVAKVATETLGSGTADAFEDLKKKIQARARRDTELRKGLVELTVAGAAMLGVFLLVLFGMLAVPSTRTMLLSPGIGRIVSGVAFLFLAWGLYLTEQVWRRQEAAANAAL